MRLAWLSILLFVIAVTLTYPHRSGPVQESPVLLTTLNILSCGAASLLVVYLAGRTYLAGGSGAALLLGCGALAFGVMYSFVGALMGRIGVAVTFHNGGVCLAGACFLASAGLALRQGARQTIAARARLRLALSYSCVLAVLALALICVQAGVIPDFYVAGRGMTPLRQAVLWLSVVEFLTAALCLSMLYGRLRTPFTLFYCVALVLIGLGMAAVGLESAPGTPLSWVGRCGQWAGGACMLISIWSLARASWEIPLQRSLRESEARYRSLVDMSPDAIMVAAGARLLFANRAAAKLFGAPSGDALVGRSVMDLVHPDFREMLAQRVRLIAEAGRAAPPAEMLALRLDGTPLSVEVTSASIEYEGQPAAQAVIRDVTERRRAGEALRDSETRYRSLFEDSPIPLWEGDWSDIKRYVERLRASGVTDFRAYFETHHDELARCAPLVKILDVNRANLPFFGVSRKEDVPVNILDQFVEQSWVVFRETAIALAEGRTSFESEVPLRTPAGEMKLLIIRLSIIRGYEETLSRVLVSLADITERKHAEEALRRSQEEYRHLVEGSGSVILRVDKEMRIAFVNRYGLRFFNYSPEEIIGKRALGTIVPARDAAGADIAAMAQDLMRHPHKYATNVHQNMRKDGSLVWMSWANKPSYDDQGNLVEILSIGNDISRLKEAEDALRRSEEALRQANEHLEQKVQERTAELALRASQLRALASELTLTEQRERRRLAKVLHDHLQQVLVGARFRTAILGRNAEPIVKQAADEIERLLGEAISVSRSLTAELSPPILHEGGLSAGLEWLSRWMADKHGLVVDLSLEKNVPPLAEDVRVLLFESVRELLFNAVKHARVHSATVNLRQVEGPALQVTVSDEGRGFDPARLKPAGGPDGGLGLFSIRERLDLIGGRVEIESAPGRGSRFILTAPPGQPEMAEPPRAAPPEAASAGESAGAAMPAAEAVLPGISACIRVLLADDRAVMREGLARLIAHESDMEVVGEAADGETAVELAGRLLPDVVLMDMSMPRLSGLDATRAIRRSHPAIAVIGLSMFEEAERAQAMRDAGAVNYLSKSDAATALVAAIRAARR